MALKKKETDDTTGTPTEDMVPASVLEQVLSRLTDVMEQQARIARAQAKNAPRRRKTLAEHRKENPPKRLVRPTYQNGREVNPDMIRADLLPVLDTIAAGKYGDGALICMRIGEGSETRIHFMYSNKSIEQRMMFNIKYPSFNSLIEQTVAEMAARGIAPVLDPAPPFAVDDEPVDNQEDEIGELVSKP